MADTTRYTTRVTRVQVFTVQPAPQQNAYQRPVPPPSPPSHYVRVEDHDRFSACNICIFLMLVGLAIIPFTMMVIGAHLYYECPNNTNIGKYMVVQGVFGLLIPSILIIWHCGRCVECKTVFCICIPIIAFILIWAIVGYVWVINSKCSDYRIHGYAIGFSTPLWIIDLIIIGICCCNKNDD